MFWLKPVSVKLIETRFFAPLGRKLWVACIPVKPSIFFKCRHIFTSHYTPTRKVRYLDDMQITVYSFPLWNAEKGCLTRIHILHVIYNLPSLWNTPCYFQHIKRCFLILMPIYQCDMLILNTNNFCLRTKQTAKPCTGYGHNEAYYKLKFVSIFY